MHLLKQSTAASIVVGPVLDASGVAYTGAVIGDFTLSKNGTSAALAAAATATHEANGHYVITLTTGNTDTLGRATVYCNKATYAMSIAHFEILAATTFDAIVTNAAGSASGLFRFGDVQATVTTVTNQLTAAAIATGVWQDATGADFTAVSSIGKSLYTSGVVPGDTNGLFIAGTNAATTITTGLTTHFIGTVDTVTTYTGNTPQTGDSFARIGATGSGLTSLAPSSTALSAGTGSNQISLSAGLVTLAGVTHTGAVIPTVTTLTNLPAITTDWLTDTGVAASAVTKIQAGLATPTNITAGTITTTTNLTNAPTVGDFTATMKASITTAATAATPTVTAGTVSDKTGYSLAASQHVIVDSGTVTTLTNLPAAPTDWLTAAAVKADAVTKIQAGLSTYAGGDTSGTTTLLSRIGSALTISAGAVTVGAYASGQDPATLVLDTAASGHNVSGTIGEAINLAGGAGGGSDPATIAAAVWQDVTAGHFTVSGSIGKSLFTSGNAPGTSGGLLKVGTSPLPASGTLAKAVWDEINTGATHNIANSTGKQLRSIGGTSASSVIYGPVTLPSQAGMTATQIKLDAGASSVSQVYRYNVISVISGTDAGDSAVIINYNGSTKVCDLDEPVAVQPDNTSVAEITPGAKALVIDKTGFSLAATGLDLLPAGSLDGKGDWLTSLGSTAPSNWITSAVIASAALNGKGDWLVTTDARLNNLDRTISSRSTYAGGPVASVLAAVTLPGIPTGWITAPGIADGALAGKGDWSTLTAAQAADKVVGRNIEGGSDGGRTVGQALAFLRNKWTIVGNTLIVYAANDTNTLWTATVSTATSNPITGIDPV